MPLLLVTDATSVTSVPCICLGTAVLKAEGFCAAFCLPSPGLGGQAVTVLGLCGCHRDSQRVPSCPRSAGILRDRIFRFQIPPGKGSSHQAVPPTGEMIINAPFPWLSCCQAAGISFLEPGGFYPRSGARYLFGGRVFPGKLAAESDRLCSG